MDIIEFFHSQQSYLHEHFRSILTSLTLDELHYLPGGVSNHIAFILWHCVRTEDNVLHLVLQERKPLWTEEKWYERLQVTARGQGTGLTVEEAHAFRINDPVLFLQYAELVWQEFEAYLAAIQDGGAELSARIVTTQILGTQPAIQTIGQACITHPTMHLGEIAALLGMQGKKGMDI